MFSDDEVATLRKHKIAVFCDRVILEARKPIDAKQLAKVEARLTGPLPSGLRDLWGASFGGALDYDIGISLGSRRHTCSFTQLFYPRSDHYRDLWGWMDHELELAAEVAEERRQPAPETLSIVPFGGFEYLERFYVSLEPERVGKVYVWAKGLPPAWKMKLNQDTVALAAGSVEELFGQLTLDEDPFADGADPNLKGIRMAEAHDNVAKKHGALASKLRDVIREAVFDWRSVVAAGTFKDSAKQRRAAALALTAIAEKDDVSLLESLLASGYPMDGIISGDATVLTLAVLGNSKRVAEALLASDRPLGNAPIIYAEGTSGALVDKLIARGVCFDIEAVLSVASGGELDAARAILNRGERSGDFGDVSKAIVRRAEQEDECARSMDAGTLHADEPASAFRKKARHLRKLAASLSK